MTMRDWERDAEIVSLYRQGETLQSIGNRYGVTRERINQIRRRAGEPRRGPRRSKFDFDRAVALYQEGWSMVRIAAAMGVHFSTVRELLVRRGVQRRPLGRRAKTGT